MSICLSMIVKNESHCIEKCLESVKNYINYWVICDTGSSDNTEEIVKKVLKGIPGKFIKHKWINFSHNRNLSLAIAKTKADYVLIIDADDYIINGEELKNLTEPAYSIEILHSTISYFRTQIINSKIKAEYKGVLHEYLDLNENVTQLKECKMIFGGTGARSKDPNKYIKDAEILQKYVDQNPHDSRNVFYLAQSYRDASKLDKAYDYYFARTKMGGWSEEIYISYLEMAKILDKIGDDISNIEEAYLNAYFVDESRIEALYYLMVVNNKNNNFNKVKLYKKLACNLEYKDGLFVEKDLFYYIKNWNV